MIDVKTESQVLEGGTCVLSIAGELDLHTAPQFEEELLRALGNEPVAMVVDLTECEFLDSTALGILVRMREHFGSSPTGVSLVAADHHVRKLFEITGLDSAFPIHPSRSAALKLVPSWQDGEARMRGLFRQVNERIAELGEGFEREGRWPFVCECGNRDCTDSIELMPAEYEAVRAQPRHFVIALDHEDPGLEVVIFQSSRYAVVETLVGEASRIAEETDPRARVQPSGAAEPGLPAPSFR